METTRKDGGPAFPGNHLEQRPFSSEVPVPHDGMSLRDYFAAKALQGYLAGVGGTGTGTKALETVAESRGVSIPELLARASYQYADAMLAAR